VKEFDPESLLPPPPESHGPITPLMVEYLRETKPWVRFMSVIMFVMVGLILIGSVFMLLIPAGGIFLALIYVAMGVLYLFPAYFLHQYASAIRSLERGGGDVAMEDALRSQKSFWRFVGILTLIIMVIYGIILVVFILGAASAGLNR
jgi:hypothetical protein